MISPKKFRHNFLPASLLFVLVLFLPSCRQSADTFPFETALDDGWHIRSSAEVSEEGESLSRSGYDVQNWYPTTVPSTVLAALVKNRIYGDVFFGKNLENVPAEPFKNSWWYRKEFALENIEAFSHARLILEGINYRANIWLNGNKIASADKLFGAFRIFEIDITDVLIQGTNTLALEVLPPQPGDFTIGFVDWNPRPPDENMGIWREVKLRLSGPVSIDNPFVRSEVNLDTLEEARLIVSADLVNRTGEKVSGVLNGEIEDIRFEQSFLLEPFEEREISFHPEEFGSLALSRPLLWWPNNMGEQNLYPIRLTASVDGRVSDVQDFKFGIRDVSDYINERGHRGYKINGKKVLIRGGGWVDDLFLVEDPKKIEIQIKYAKHMNLNVLRLEGFWGSSQTLYDLADRYGLLLMAGWSCHWEWEEYLGKPVDKFGGIQTPEEMDLIARSLRDQVVWLRNHPSVFVWALGSDRLPRPELEKKYYTILNGIDPTRPTLAACGYLESEISGPTAVKMNGPYDYVTPNYWYEDKKRGGAFGFNTETGPGPQPPPLESIMKMIPQDHLWPIDDEWNFHCARNEFNTLDRYIHALDNRYGAAKSVEEFARIAQVASYEAMRAMFESFGVNKHNATGIIQWMYNSAWPAMFWQLFDYYLMPNGAFYGAKTGSEPLNLVYNYGSEDIYIVNDTLHAFENLTAEVRVLNVDSKALLSESIPVSVDENTSKKIFDMSPMDGLSSVYFLDLKLKDADGKAVSRNFYWLSIKKDVLDETNSTWFYTPNQSFADFKGLKDLPEVQVKASCRIADLGNEQEIQVSLENLSDTIALFIELKLIGEESGDSVLPIFWDENYLSLLPGETRKISARFLKEDLKGEAPVFRFSGWNVKGDRVPIVEKM